MCCCYKLRQFSHLKEAAHSSLWCFGYLTLICIHFYVLCLKSFVLPGSECHLKWLSMDFSAQLFRKIKITCWSLFPNAKSCHVFPQQKLRISKNRTLKGADRCDFRWQCRWRILALSCFSHIIRAAQTLAWEKSEETLLSVEQCRLQDFWN